MSNFTLPVAFGTYTPTLTATANIDAQNAYPCNYLKVGNMVTVSGHVDIDPTAGASTTQLRVSLPFASDFTTADQCAGVIAATAVSGLTGAVKPDVTNNDALIQFNSASTTSLTGMYFTFTYLIN